MWLLSKWIVNLHTVINKHAEFWGTPILKCRNCMHNLANNSFKHRPLRYTNHQWTDSMETICHPWRIQSSIKLCDVFTFQNDFDQLKKKYSPAGKRFLRGFKFDLFEILSSLANGYLNSASRIPWLAKMSTYIQKKGRKLLKIYICRLLCREEQI